MLSFGRPVSGLCARMARFAVVFGVVAPVALFSLPAFAQAAGAVAVVTAPKAQAVYLDDSASFTYDVSNPGSADLTGVSVADDRCPAVTGPDTSTAVDPDNNGDDVLQSGETWRYGCTVKAADLFKAGTDPVSSTATATAAAADESGTVMGKDSVLTALLVPAIAIDKTGPQSGTAGELLTYDLAVKNTGNTDFPEAGVKLTDTVLTGGACAAAPAVPTSKNGDRTPAELNPGETWVYQCQIQTRAGETKVSNKGDVSGTDAGGRTVGATDTTDTVLSAPAGAVLPASNVSGRARLTGTVGCVASRRATATVTGGNVTKVTFSVNGRTVRTLTKAGSGGSFRLVLTTRSLAYGTYKVRATVRFAADAVPRSRTLSLQFSRCRPRVVIRPQFAG